MNKTSVRKATTEDIDSIVNLGENVPEFDVSERTIGFWAKETLSNAVSSDTVVILVAESDSKLVGFIIANYNSGLKKAIIENILVTQENRNKGVGNDLLMSLLTELEGVGCEYVTSLIPASAKGVEELYMRHGFSVGKQFVWVDKSLSDRFKKT